MVLPQFNSRKRGLAKSRVDITVNGRKVYKDKMLIATVPINAHQPLSNQGGAPVR